MNKSHFFSFKNKIAVSFFFSTAIPILLLAIFFYSLNLKNVKKTELDQFQKQLSSVLKECDTTIDSIYMFSNHIFSNATLNHFFMQGLYNDVELIAKLNGEIDSLISWIRLLKPSSITSFKFLTENFSIPETSYIERMDSVHYDLLKVKSIYNEHRHSESNDFFYIFPLNSKILNRNTYIDIEVNTLKLFTPLINLSQINKSLLYLYNSDRSLIYASTKPSLSLPSPIISEQELLNTKITINHVSYYVTSFKLYNDSFYGIIGLPCQNIDGKLKQTVSSFIFLLLLLLLFFGIFIYFCAHFSLLRLKNIISSIGQIQTGHFKIAIPHQGRDEIDELAENINIMSYEIDKLINEVYTADLKQKKLIVSALQKQINPHFIYNTLECIRMKAELNDQIEISDNIMALGSIMRYNISVGKDSETLDTEIKNIEDYIAIQNILNNNRIQYTLSLNNIPTHLLVPKFCLQPIIENSICHGMDYRKDFLVLSLSVFIENENLYLTLSDNGLGIEPFMIEKMNINFENFYNTMPLEMEHGVALYNINSRIKLSCGTTYGLWAYSELGHGLTIQLKLPIHT